MKIVAVIPVFGRLSLLKFTIKRLYEKNKCYKVICVGDQLEDRLLCEKMGAIWVGHPNKPLGSKWNFGFIKAREYHPDACLFVGSSDWVSDNWIAESTKHLPFADMIGRADCYFLDIRNKDKIDKYRLVYWSGYGDNLFNGIRKNETIGIGRILSRNILEKMNWQPFQKEKDNSMDWMMYQNVLKNGGKVLQLDNDSMYSLSISTDLWVNKHKFINHWNMNIKNSERIKNYTDFLKDNFPEAFEIFK